MIDRAACEYALTQANTLAFLRVIRQGETNQSDDAYRTVNGGGRFTDLSRHPYDGQPSPPAKASGAYQFLGTTWAGIKVKLDLHDFSPASQDLGAVALIQGRGALQDVLDGNFDSAVTKCRKEWTSLPGAAENNPRWTLEKAREVYQQYGGTFTKSSAGLSPTITFPAERKPMPIPAILGAVATFGPMLAELIPAIGKLFGNSEVALRNQEAAKLALDTAVRAANAVNEQDMIAKASQDPTVLQTVTQAVLTEPTIMGLLEVGGGIEKARESAIAMQSAPRTFLWNPLFWITMALLPMMYMIVASVLGTTNSGTPGAPWWAQVGFDPQTRSGLINLIVGFIFGGVCGIWFGTSYGSQKKDEVVAARVG